MNRKVSLLLVLVSISLFMVVLAAPVQIITKTTCKDIPYAYGGGAAKLHLCYTLKYQYSDGFIRPISVESRYR